MFGTQSVWDFGCFLLGTGLCVVEFRAACLVYGLSHGFSPQHGSTTARVLTGLGRRRKSVTGKVLRPSARGHGSGNRKARLSEMEMDVFCCVPIVFSRCPDLPGRSKHRSEES